ncbi:MAG: hypothetical protein H7249_16785 [Chitinophagaceae bacterium]|nr:hypothetical protein [Oligoflexus sp.]
MRMKALIPLVFSCTALCGLEPFAKASEKELDFKALKHFQITLENAIYGVFREDKTVLSFPGESAFYMKSHYNPDAKEQDLAFGTLHNPYEGSERINFEPKDKQRRIRSVLHVAPLWAFLDSKNQQLLIWNDVLKAWIMPGDIILDTARPPRDARGEPTRAETQALKTKMTKALAKEKRNPDLLAGITEIPKIWKDHDGSQYVVWLRGGPHPLMTLKCDITSFRVCQVQRVCAVKGLSAAESQNVTSITLDHHSQSLIVLFGSQQTVKRLEGHSCASLAAKPGLRLPKELANAQGLFVDKENNLWLALRASEGGTSASVMSWDSKSWE